MLSKIIPLRVVVLFTKVQLEEQTHHRGLGSIQIPFNPNVLCVNRQSETKHSCVTTPSGSLCFCRISYIKILIHFPMQIKTYLLNYKIPRLVKEWFWSSAFIPVQSKVDWKLLPFHVQNMNSYNRKPCISFILSTREFGATSRKYTPSWCFPSNYIEW